MFVGQGDMLFHVIAQMLDFIHTQTGSMTHSWENKEGGGGGVKKKNQKSEWLSVSCTISSRLTLTLMRDIVTSAV